MVMKTLRSQPTKSFMSARATRAPGARAALAKFRPWLRIRVSAMGRCECCLDERSLRVEMIHEHHSC